MKNVECERGKSWVITDQVDVDWEVVAEAAEVARSDVGAEEFLAVIGLVVLQHEVGMEDTGASFLIMKAFPVIHHAFRYDNLIENLPVGLMLQGAFKAQAFVFFFFFLTAEKNFFLSAFPKFNYK